MWAHSRKNEKTVILVILFHQYMHPDGKSYARKHARPRMVKVYARKHARLRIYSSFSPTNDSIMLPSYDYPDEIPISCFVFFRSFVSIIKLDFYPRGDLYVELVKLMFKDDSVVKKKTSE